MKQKTKKVIKVSKQLHLILKTESNVEGMIFEKFVEKILEIGLKQYETNKK